MPPPPKNPKLADLVEPLIEYREIEVQAKSHRVPNDLRKSTRHQVVKVAEILGGKPEDCHFSDLLDLLWSWQRRTAHLSIPSNSMSVYRGAARDLLLAGVYRQTTRIPVAFPAATGFPSLAPDQSIPLAKRHAMVAARLLFVELLASGKNLQTCAAKDLVNFEARLRRHRSDGEQKLKHLQRWWWGEVDAGRLPAIGLARPTGGRRYKNAAVRLDELPEPARRALLELFEKCGWNGTLDETGTTLHSNVTRFRVYIGDLLRNNLIAPDEITELHKLFEWPQIKAFLRRHAESNGHTRLGGWEEVFLSTLSVVYQRLGDPATAAKARRHAKRIRKTKQPVYSNRDLTPTTTQLMNVATALLQERDRRVTEARKNGREPAWFDAASLTRDALLFGLLAIHPMRQSIHVGFTVRDVEEIERHGMALYVAPYDSDRGKGRGVGGHMVVPPWLRDLVRFYVDECRPVLSGGLHTDAFWVGGVVKDEPALNAAGLRDIYKRRMVEFASMQSKFHNTRHALATGFIDWTGGLDGGDYLTLARLLISNDPLGVEKFYRTYRGKDEHRRISEFTQRKTAQARGQDASGAGGVK